MSLAAGSKLGPYEIVALIGSGGMGEVYRAHDPELKRDVALKVLPDAFANDPERLARFAREAQVLASLNHPNIAQIYGIEGRALVMELVEGDSPKGPMPFEEGWNIASQIAGALEYAHEKGVIHRDLKPANVKVTPEGVVKLLDFGLAKAFRGEAVAAGDSENSPTLTLGATQLGVILGTAAYMAPEQAKGKTVDRRADIWSFGVVFYELLIGERLFKGEDVSDTLAQVLTKQPEIGKAPAPARKLLRHCLEKDPRKRLRDIGDAAALLEISPEVPPAPPRQKLIPWAVAALAVAALGTVLLWHFSRRPAQTQISGPLTRATIDLPADAQLALGTQIPLEGFDSPAVALSPDGRYLAYVGQSSSGNILFLRETGGMTIRPVPGTEGAIYAFFSPDSRWLGFLTNDKVKKVSIDGGAPTTLSDAVAPVTASWTLDDSIYFGAQEGFDLFRVPASGGATTLIGPKTPGRGTGPFPLWGQLSQVLPDAKSALMTSARPGLGVGYSDVILVSLASQKAKVLIHSAYGARYIASGYLLFGRSGSLFAARFNSAREETEGDPFPVASGVSMESIFGQVHFSASDKGLIAYVPGNDRAVGRLAWIDRQGRTEFLPPPPRLYGVVDLSRNGDRLAVEVADVTDYIWVYDLKRNEGRKLAANAPRISPIWNPDGVTLTFVEWQESNPGAILTEPADGGRVQELLKASPEFRGRPERWSPDGRVLSLDGPLVLRDGKRERIPNVPENAWVSAFSPDGRWIAYSSSESGRTEVFVRSFPDGNQVRQISVDGGIEVRWCRCGELFWRNGNRWMSSVIRTQPELSWEPPHTAFQTDFIDTPGISYDVSPDGKRLLVAKRTEPDERSHINLVAGWMEPVKRQ